MIASERETLSCCDFYFHFNIFICSKADTLTQMSGSDLNPGQKYGMALSVK